MKVKMTVMEFKNSDGSWDFDFGEEIMYSVCDKCFSKVAVLGLPSGKMVKSLGFLKHEEIKFCPICGHDELVPHGFINYNEDRIKEGL